MAMVTLRWTKSISVQADAVRAWQLPATGVAGLARFTLPLTSPAASADYLSDTGGSFVYIASEDGCGDWSGVVTFIEWREHEVEVESAQSWVILSRIPVDLDRRYRNVSAGYLAYIAITRAVHAIGSYPLAVGGVAETPPFVPEYTLSGESLWAVLLDLQRLSGAEVSIRSFSPSGEGIGTQENRQSIDLIDWGAATKSRYARVLMAPGQLADAVYALDITDQVSVVTAMDAGRWYSAVSGVAAGEARWPAQVVIKEQVNSINELKSLAEAELGARQFARVIVSGNVPRSHWDIREGDTVTAVIPWARFTGVTARCRVISREVGHSDEFMRVEMRFIDETAGLRAVGGERGFAFYSRQAARAQQSGTLYQFRR